VFQEYQLHPFITVRPKLAVIGRIQIQERTGLRQHPALKRAAVDGGNAIAAGGFGAIGIEFDAGQMGTGIACDLQQRGAIADTGIDGRIWCRR
jgi:hypothetical protein